MKKLLKAFKKLPPEARMVLTLMGLGSPLGALYFLRRFFPGVSMQVLILCVAGVGLAIAGIIWLITLVFTRGRKVRSSRMAAELADGGQAGPQSVDVSAAIKANNEKFFKATRDLRKNVGISVYDLPWYVVIGDSGCGKTKLVNEGGLTFSTGKPEGYQLGTLNYNWWFTEDAIFIDMAGRLCNPQDDSDRREWSAFLDAIGKGRRGFPINGALVCVSADHLLQDPPEKHEADANVALERLRDLQTKLGVTFATYLIVTKCDKILGFMHFFDRAERDITVKNQIFGWSKPGDFNELYDPERFKEDFDRVYVRLHDLRVRRMNDDAEEIDLGLAYSFPEEFRQLYEPVHTYVRTLFPFIRNPRAVKNLIFRGVYFTSATQEGELILKHLRERLGTEAADQFPPLDDLYPNKRPHFIKDVLFRKVFPEHGLVFRNEGQVIRHKKLSKALQVGTAMLAVVLVAAFWWSSATFNGVIGQPRSNAAEAAKSIEGLTPTAALEKAAATAADVRSLDAHRMAAMVLSLGVGTDRPRDDLERIRVALVEKAVVKALAEAGDALRSGAALQQADTQEAKAYFAALEQYVVWFGCRNEAAAPARVTAEGFETLCGVLGAGSIKQTNGFAEQTGWYFPAVRKGGEAGRNPARLIASAGGDATETIATALGHAYEHYARHYATLGSEHADGNIREWMRLREACLTMAGGYDAMLRAAAGVERIETLEGLETFKTSFLREFAAFDAALDGLTWRGAGAGPHLYDIRLLSNLILDQREVWVGYQGRLAAAAGTCGAPDANVLAAIEELRTGDSSGVKGLDWVLWDSLRERGIVTVPYIPTAYDDKKAFDQYTSEVYESFAEILRFDKGDSRTVTDQVRPTEGATTVRQAIRRIRDALAKADFNVPENLGDQNAALWIEGLQRHVEGGAPEEEPVDVAALSSYWKPDVLGRVHGRCRDLIRLGEGTRLLRTMLAGLRQVQAPETWGYATVGPFEEWSAMERSPYTIPQPARPEAGPHRPVQPDDGERGPALPDRTRERVGQRPRLEPPPLTPGAPVARETRAPDAVRATGQIPACATHAFLNDQAKDWILLLFYLGEMRGRFLPETGSSERMQERCAEDLEKSIRAYMAAYVGAWNRAYAGRALETLNRIADRASDWEQLAGRLSQADRRGVVDELIPAMSTILQAIPYADCFPNGARWDSLGAPQWLSVSAWMRESIVQGWNTAEQGYFAGNARAPTGGAGLTAPPWVVVSKEVADAWNMLGEEIANNARVPQRFTSDVTWRGAAIRWGALAKLREQYALDGEKLTGQLIDFERQAQHLLSARLTETLCGIQQHFLGDVSPFDGWPYLPGEAYTRDGLTAVELDPFIGFLVEVHRAKTAFGPIETGLTTIAPGYADRQAFYLSCEQWFSFLGLKDEPRPTPVALRLTVFSADPMREPFGRERVTDTCQHTARWLDLDLGLVLGPDARAGGGTGLLRIACESTYKKPGGDPATWPWDAKPGKPLTVALTEFLEKIKDPGAKTLGTYSPLALCAYLHRYGVGQDQNKTWYVTHSFTHQKADEAPETIGEKLRFQLEQPLPEPIPRLSRVSVAAPGPR